MDPMIGFVRDRTSDLQRIADDVRRERHLRAIDVAPTTVAAVLGASPSVELAEIAELDCEPCQPSATARHAA
jgi:hypothetical protein